MRMLKNAVIYLIEHNRRLHCTRIRIFEIIFSILDLPRSVLSMIATPADDLPVINDSQACQYAGEAVEVRSSIFAVPISSLGTAFINSRREYPGQTFAEFIGSAEEVLTLVAGKTMLLLMATLGLILTASLSCAGLGWTLAQFKQQYGEPVLSQEQIGGRIGYAFTGGDYIIATFFRNEHVSRIMYICPSAVFNWARARALLGANAPDAIWADASKNEAENFYRVNGTKDGVETYYAALTDDGRMLVIWTKEDDEAGRISLKLDAPPVSSVMGSNEKSTVEIAAGQTPSIDSGLTPKMNRPDLRANATLWSPSQPPDSARAADTKPKVRLRSSTQPRHVDVKARLIALWRQSLRNEKSRGSNEAARKKVSYTVKARN
jgi:hypothetical protein